MYGAILGDIIGSPFEFDRGDKTKEFRLFTKGCCYTDDSVLTIAVGQALLEVGKKGSVDEIKKSVVKNMRIWSDKYPYAGYGARFVRWLTSRNPKPYGSFGNGSAMRVSAAGWLYESIERTREVAEATAIVTHNHPEGIKGAVAVASCIYLARNGATKGKIKKYVENEFKYDLRRTLADIRPTYHHVESCQQTVPEAITAFLESDGFEDAIRNAVSLGGDTDTLAAITGSIAEAFYGVPEHLKRECRSRISKDMLSVLNEFDNIFGRKKAHENIELTRNIHVEQAIEEFYNDENHENFVWVLTELCLAMENGSYGLITSATEDNEWLYFFTNESEAHSREISGVVTQAPIIEILKAALENESAAGLIINPFGKHFVMEKHVIDITLKAYMEESELLT